MANSFRHRSALILVFVAASLIGMGLVELASASQSFVREDYFAKQCVWLLMACVAGTFTTLIDLQKIRQWIPWMSVISVGLLLIVLVPGIGIKVNGSRRWLGFGFMRFQVSEFAKLTLIFLLAHYTAQNQRVLSHFKKGFLIPSCIIGFFSVLILAEPDFGTAFLCGIVGMVLLFIAGTELKYLVPSLFLGLITFGVGISLNPVRLQRITSFWNVEENRLQGAYQLWQGILGFAAGGVKGMGLGNGRQQIYFLPEAHTDFIFPVLGEELGFYVTAAVVAAFLIIFIVGIYELRRVPSMYYFILGMGALLFIVLQALINMGVVMGILPTKGMSLPFISYGGSNLVLMFIFIGILLNCFRTFDTIPNIAGEDL